MLPDYVKLVDGDHQILRTRMPEHIGSTDNLSVLVRWMFLAMEKFGGIGLSANQIGLYHRVFVMKTMNGPSMVCINPVIESFEPVTAAFNEGCLSFPSERVMTNRPIEIIVSYIDFWTGNHVQQRLVNLDAICFQHELDHLNGITFHEREMKSS